MKKEKFDRLKKSMEQAIAYERGDAEAGRVTVREQPVKKLRINIMLDEDIVEHFKRRAARPNTAPYQTQINQALRELIGKSSQEYVEDTQVEKIADRIAEKVAERLRRGKKRKAA
ncbi:MAG: BrnA antitoxin family protein [Acidobacteria bacterium]|nr:BrnA antitoxin family protein [Acidobacteriota bacterium]MCI0662981.1 BrnA antitoxin family protein [Acidobacteriota bacterium]